MLTELKAYSSWQSAPTLLLDEDGSAETDLIQIRNIDGLDPVKASVNTSPLAYVDGTSYVGSNVPSRNIVITVSTNPNWITWSYESLRALLYSYFMPKRLTRLVFYSDNKVPVEISGIVESVSVNQFSKDPEIAISIICPDPYFIAVEPVVLTGSAIRSDGVVTTIDYNGNIETGVYVKVTKVSGSNPTSIGIQIGNVDISYFNIDATVSDTLYFEMCSIPMQKFVHNVNITNGLIENLLSDVEEGSSWTILQPGENDFSIVTDQGVQDWELRYYEKFGGL